uniref:Uncharacterized protein n=1 Tax=Cryptococcus bacillisporus CA1280 TaxID=1296109 RepID=A0A0D0TKW5_CRYGA|nr:hypothetical protein I312_03441 [Cryptococcus bacillisporus CA1280]
MGVKRAVNVPGEGPSVELTAFSSAVADWLFLFLPAPALALPPQLSHSPPQLPGPTPQQVLSAWLTLGHGVIGEAERIGGSFEVLIAELIEDFMGNVG